MNLDTASQLELVTDLSGTIHVTVAWIDSLSGSLPQTDQFVITGAAVTTTIVAAPASGTRRVLHITVRNAAATVQGVTIQKDVSGTNYPVGPTIPLEADESLEYEFGRQFTTYASSGKRKRAEILAGADWGSAFPNAIYYSGTAAGTRAVGAGLNGYAVWVGKATRQRTSLTLHVRLTTAAVTVTSAEASILIGKPRQANDPSAISQNQTLQVVGWSDVSAIVTGLGILRMAISCTNGYVVNAGDDVWLGLQTQATTQPVLRAANGLNENNTLGLSVLLNIGVRTSQIVGAPTMMSGDTGTMLLIGVSGL